MHLYDDRTTIKAAAADIKSRIEVTRNDEKKFVKRSAYDFTCALPLHGWLTHFSVLMSTEYSIVSLTFSVSAKCQCRRILLAYYR